MGSNYPTAAIHKITDGLVQLGFGRVRMHIENEDLAGIQPRSPQMPPIVGESRVMSFVAASDRECMDNLTVVGRVWSYVNGD